MWYDIVIRVFNFLACKLDDLVTTNEFTVTALSAMDKMMCYLVDLWTDSSIVECKINGHRYTSDTQSKNCVLFMVIALYRLDLAFPIDNTNLDFLANAVKKHEIIRCRSCGLEANMDSL